MWKEKKVKKRRDPTTINKNKIKPLQTDLAGTPECPHMTHSG